MTRQEFIKRNVQYGAIVMRLGAPCALILASAFIGGLLVHSERTEINVVFLVAIIVPFLACVIPLNRLHRRHRLWWRMAQIRLASS